MTKRVRTFLETSICGVIAGYGFSVFWTLYTDLPMSWVESHGRLFGVLRTITLGAGGMFVVVGWLFVPLSFLCRPLLQAAARRRLPLLTLATILFVGVGAAVLLAYLTTVQIILIEEWSFRVLFYPATHTLAIHNMLECLRYWAIPCIVLAVGAYCLVSRHPVSS
jgi:hypothetical protein